jgi:hypothetical protein
MFCYPILAAMKLRLGWGHGKYNIYRMSLSKRNLRISGSRFALSSIVALSFMTPVLKA